MELVRINNQEMYYEPTYLDLTRLDVNINKDDKSNTSEHYSLCCIDCNAHTGIPLECFHLRSDSKCIY